MADLTPGEIAKLDQIHANITTKLAELISSAVDGIRQEGEALTASALAGTAQATDHNSISALFAALLVRHARYLMAEQKRGTLTRTEDGYASEHYEADGNLDADYLYVGDPEGMRAHAIESTDRYHNDPDYPYAYSRVIRYTDRTYRTIEEVVFELGTKPETTDG